MTTGEIKVINYGKFGFSKSKNVVSSIDKRRKVQSFYEVIIDYRIMLTITNDEKSSKVDAKKESIKNVTWHEMLNLLKTTTSFTDHDQ